METNRPKVGVGVMILRGGKVLLGKRKNAHGAGEYAFPGGHLEHLESFEDCVLREVAEECGVAIENIRFQYVANLQTYAPKHYVHIGMIADWKSGEPKVLEPDKLESWDWYDVNDLPSPVFATTTLALESYKKQKVYFGTIK